jgi:hypothetical protein
MVLAQIASTAADHTIYWDAVQDIRRGTAGESIAFLVLQMIYRADTGDIEEAVAIANNLRLRVAEIPDHFEQLSVLTAISDTYRIGDQVVGATEVARIAMDTALAIGSEHFECTSLVRLAALQLDAGMLELAQESYARLQLRQVDRNDEISNLSTEVLAARLAIADGRYAEALALAVQHWNRARAGGIRSLWSVRSSTVLMAEVLLRSNSEPLDDDLIAQLLSVHTATCGFPLHDRTAAVTFVALSRSGRSAEARATLMEYRNYHRRSVTPWAVASTRLGYPEADLDERSGDAAMSAGSTPNAK